MSNHNILGGRNSLRVTAFAALATVTLSACGASQEDSQRALDTVVTHDGYSVLQKGQNQLGGMIYDEVAVGPQCVAEVWSASNDADLTGPLDESPMTVYVYTNPERGHNQVEQFVANRFSLPHLKTMLGRPAVAHSCPVAPGQTTQAVSPVG